MNCFNNLRELRAKVFPVKSLDVNITWSSFDLKIFLCPKTNNMEVDNLALGS